MPQPFYRLPDRSSEGLTSRSSLRIAVLGMIALGFFAIVFFRLWYLQVLSGDEYLAEANQNRTRDIRVEAPRGQIFDRNGNVLVDNRSSWQVRVDQREWGIGLTPKNQYLRFNDPSFEPVLSRLSKALDQPQSELKEKMRDSLLQDPVANAIVAEDVKYASVVEISENSQEFPDVDVSQTFERGYPRGDLAAHLFGYVREVSQKQLLSGDYEGARQGDRVGQDGLEAEYDSYLRGRSGIQRIEVDVTDRSQRELPGRAPLTGDSLRLTIDTQVQRAGEQAIARGSAGIPTHGSAFVAMDINTGEIHGLGSYPNFDPSVFTGVLKPSEYKRISSKANGTPIVNRAVASEYAPGSTFKPISSIATLSAGVVTPNEVIADNGTFEFGGRTWQNAGKVPNGPVDLVSAMRVSSDIYYYIMGMRAYRKGDQLIQKWASRMGLGRSPEIDLPYSAPGQVSSPKVIESQLDRDYNIGDNMNMAVGQGSTLVSPLQMAIAYSALGNGGYVVTPHLGKRIDNSRGQAIQDIEQPTRRRVSMSPTYTSQILQGLHEAAQVPGGTSYDVFSDFPVKIAGKTGTAEVFGKEDQSWYVALAPYPNPRYVVAVTVEQGGFGAESAAPAARQILHKLLRVDGENLWKPGKSQDQ